MQEYFSDGNSKAVVCILAKTRQVVWGNSNLIIYNIQTEYLLNVTHNNLKHLDIAIRYWVKGMFLWVTYKGT